MTDNEHPDEELRAGDETTIARALRGSAIAVVAIASIVAGVMWWMGREPDVAPAEEAVLQPVIEREADETVPTIAFVDRTQAAGIDFIAENAARGAKLLPETMGAGCAFFDYDGDGDSDLLLCNAAPWDGDDVDAARTQTTILYANDGKGHFTDVTAAAGLEVAFYGTGVACADVDGDGDVDVYLTALGENRLMRNDGGVFTDVTSTAGVAGDASDWSTSAGFFDADNDGDVDLFVCNYITWSREIDEELATKLTGVGRAYGAPVQFKGAHCRFYLNAGDGTFADHSEAAGIRVTNTATGVPVAKALGVTFLDLGGDGWLDIVVANDTVQNFVFRNERDGTFTEVGTMSGIAYDGQGSSTGAMGIDVADFRNEGSLAFGIGNFANEMTSLFVADSDPWQFTDVARIEGIGAPSRQALSFGLFFFDADLDGRLDLFQTNGHLEDEINKVQPSQHYRQPSQLFWNAGPASRSTYVEMEDAQIGDLARAVVGRGSAYADIDGDGDVDLLITQSGEAPLLLVNDQGLGHHWLRVSLRGAAPATDAIGAWVTLEAGGVTQRRQVMPTRSYMSQVELPVTFGLGAQTEIDRLTIRWPDGSEQDVAVEGVDRELVVEQGVTR